MNNEFVVAIMRQPDGKFIYVDRMPDEFTETESPYSAGEIEYAINRVAFDLQSRHMATMIAETMMPERASTAQRVGDALKRRKGS